MARKVSKVTIVFSCSFDMSFCHFVASVMLKNMQTILTNLCICHPWFLPPLISVNQTVDYCQCDSVNQTVDLCH